MTEMRLEKPARAGSQRAFVAVNGTDIGVRIVILLATNSCRGVTFHIVFWRLFCYFLVCAGLA